MNIFRDSSESPLEHDRSVEDRRRHRQLVEKSIKDNISDILSEESIIGDSGNKRYKIPIRGLKEYQFIYGKNTKGVGSGNGEEQRGEEIGNQEEQRGKGKGDKAGNEEGEEIYETEITLEELLDYIIEDLELPYIEKKKYSEVITKHSSKRKGYQRYGINPRLAKKRTVIAKIARKQSMKKVLRQLNKDVALNKFPFKEDDLKYYKVRPKIKKESNAAIVFIMDVSASMDNSKKYLARSFFFILSKFLRKKYNNVQITFVSHTTVASEVNEYEFFHRTESGGTYISSGLKKAIEIIKNKFPLEIWNVYAFYASDGDNWSEDNDRTIDTARELCGICNMLGYTELLPSSYGGSIYNRIVKEVVNNNFTPTVLKVKNDLWSALKLFLGKELKGN